MGRGPDGDRGNTVNPLPDTVGRVKRRVRRAWLAAAGAALGAALAVPLLAAPAGASATAAPAARHVVIVGISGLRWNQVTAAATPELWRLADGPD